MKQRDAAEKNSRQPDAMPGALSQLLSIFDRGGRRTRRPRYAPQGEREIDQALLDILWFWKIEAAPAPEEIAEENLRMEHILRPTGVMRASWSEAGMEIPSFSASTIMLRNLQISKTFPLMVQRFWRKKTGPPS